MKNAAILALVLSLSLQNAGGAYANPTPAPHESISPAQKSIAFEKFKKRPKNEFSKLMYLGDLLQKSDFTVVYNGKTYEPRSISAAISLYVLANYKQEKAEQWIAKHAYRSMTKGQIIYLRDPEGKMLLLKDVLLKELTTLPPPAAA